MSVLKHAFIFSATIAYKQNKIRLADEERERKRRLEIEEALKKAEERKRLCNKISKVSSSRILVQESWRSVGKKDPLPI